MVSERKVKGDTATSKVIADLTEKGYIVFTPAVCEHAPFDMIAFKNNKMLRIQAKYSSSGKIQNKQTWNDKHGTHMRVYSLTDFDYYAVYLPNVKTVIYPNISFGGENIKTIKTNCNNEFYWYEDFLELTDIATKRSNKPQNIISTNFSGNIPTKEEVILLISQYNSISDCADSINVDRRTFKKYINFYNLKIKSDKKSYDVKNTLEVSIIQPKDPTMSKEELEECVNYGLCYKEVEDKYQISHTTIRNLLKQNNLKLNPKKYIKSSSRKIIWPTKEELKILLWLKPTSEIAKDYNVSDNAVGKWAKSYGLSKPPRGYWQKLLAKKS